MSPRGITPLETGAALALLFLALFTILPVAWRHSMKVHRQAQTIRHWDASLAAAQEQALLRQAPRRPPIPQN